MLLEMTITNNSYIFDDATKALNLSIIKSEDISLYIFQQKLLSTQHPITTLLEFKPKK